LTGVAPLFVSFDATVGLPDDGFLDDTFVWHFDVQDVDPKGRHEQASGFVAGHVYEQPGTYFTCLSHYRTDGSVETRRWDVTVLPFSGTTVYVADDGDDSAEGTIDSPVATIEEAIEARAEPNTRILFRNGDTFDFAAEVNVEGNGPVLVSSYSDPARPSTTPPTMQFTGPGSTSYVFRVRQADDWRFVGLRLVATGHQIDNPPSSPGGIDFYLGQPTNVLLLDLELTEFGRVLVSLSGRGNGVFDSQFHRFCPMAFYGGSDPNQDIAVVGNRVWDIECNEGEEHVFRLQGGNRYFVAFNHFEATDNKSNVQVRGNTDRVVVYQNVLDRSSAFTPQNETSEEYVHHGIFDSNFVIGRTNPSWDTEYVVRGGALGTYAQDVVIRNNVFYDYDQPINIGAHPLVGGSKRISVENNTFICPRACRAVRAWCPGDGDPCEDIRVNDNLMVQQGSTGSPRFFECYYNGLTSPLPVTQSDGNLLFGNDWASNDVGHTCTSAFGGTLAKWQADTGLDGHSMVDDPALLLTNIDEALTEDPAFDNVSLDALNAFVPGPSSPARDHAVSGGPALDFYGRLRDSNPDIGAVEAP
jgi:hypothetical protein